MEQDSSVLRACSTYVIMSEGDYELNWFEHRKTPKSSNPKSQILNPTPSQDAKKKPESFLSVINQTYKNLAKVFEKLDGQRNYSGVTQRHPNWCLVYCGLHGEQSEIGLGVVTLRSNGLIGENVFF